MKIEAPVIPIRMLLATEWMCGTWGTKRRRIPTLFKFSVHRPLRENTDSSKSVCSMCATKRCWRELSMGVCVCVNASNQSPWIVEWFPSTTKHFPDIDFFLRIFIAFASQIYKVEFIQKSWISCSISSLRARKKNSHAVGTSRKLKWKKKKKTRTAFALRHH